VPSLPVHYFHSEVVFVAATASVAAILVEIEVEQYYWMD